MFINLHDLENEWWRPSSRVSADSLVAACSEIHFIIFERRFHQPKSDIIWTIAIANLAVYFPVSNIFSINYY